MWGERDSKKLYINVPVWWSTQIKEWKILNGHKCYSPSSSLTLEICYHDEHCSELSRRYPKSNVCLREMKRHVHWYIIVMSQDKTSHSFRLRWKTKCSVDLERHCLWNQYQISVFAFWMILIENRKILIWSLMCWNEKSASDEIVHDGFWNWDFWLCNELVLRILWCNSNSMFLIQENFVLENYLISAFWWSSIGSVQDEN